MRGLDKNELALIAHDRDQYWGCPYGLYAAAERLVRRGVLAWVSCPYGKHEHLADGPELKDAMRCHSAACGKVGV
jgi:hypothetical protein